MPESINESHANDRAHKLPPPAPEDSIGNLSKLPAEVRVIIYGHVLRLEKPAKITGNRHLAFFKHHTSLCPINDHETKDGRIICSNTFNKDDVTVHEAPRTVLELLLTCKAINKEALPVYPDVNSIILPSLTDVRFIQNAVGRQCFHLIKNVTVVWAYEIYPTIKALCSLTRLEILAMVFPSEPRIDCPWNYFGGFELLSNLRGVQDLKMAGKDLVWTGNGPEGSLDDADDSSSDEEGGGKSKNGKCGHQPYRTLAAQLHH
ncbi:MAG: hypothetical protein Q9188_005410 [Gyalolechia gomerana]